MLSLSKITHGTLFKQYYIMKHIFVKMADFRVLSIISTLQEVIFLIINYKRS